MIVEERKKIMRHFCGRWIINAACGEGRKQTLFSLLSNQSQKGMTVPAIPFIKQLIRNTLWAVVLHWNP